MAWTKKELTDWLKTLGAPEAKVNAAIEALGDDAIAAKIGEGVLAQGDYTRQMQKLKDDETKFKADLAKKDKDADSFRGELVAWKQGKEKEFDAAIAARTAAEGRLTEVQGKIKALGGQYGITETDLAPLMTGAPAAAVLPARREDTPRDEKGQFLTREEAQNLPIVTLVLANLADEHVKLFPNQPFDRVAIYQNAIKNNRSLSAEWEETYKVADRRATIAKDIHDRDISDAEKRGEERAKSALMAENPGLAVRIRTEQHQGSPILDRARAQAAAVAKENIGKPVEVNEGRGVDAAVAAFNAGKYQGGTEHKAA